MLPACGEDTGSAARLQRGAIDAVAQVGKLELEIDQRVAGGAQLGVGVRTGDDRLRTCRDFLDLSAQLVELRGLASTAREHDHQQDAAHDR